MTFGKRLKSLRVEFHLTQDALADAINKKYNLSFNKGMVSKWENDREDASMNSAKILSHFFNVSLDYLLCLSDVKKHDSPTVPDILKSYNKLNDSGKKEAEKRVKELTYISFYRSDNSSADEDKNSKSNVPELFAASAEDRSPENIALMESEFDDFDDI